MFNNMRIEVGFQAKLQLTFCYTVVNIKPRFMVVSFSATPSRRLVAKSKLCYCTHALLQ
jgi:hypothetical protein